MLAEEVITATLIIGGALGLFDVWLVAVSDAPQAAPSDAVPATHKVSS
jgi:hypothetical protein